MKPSPSDVLLRRIRTSLHERGIALVEQHVERETFEALANELGTIVGRERVELRPNAHAYVAKPGAVPLHTDQPQVDIIGWWCARQDDADGSSLLLDMLPLLERLPREDLLTLGETHLRTPRLEGGPPTLAWPVLQNRDGRMRVFCSPWLTALEADQRHQVALDALRSRIEGSDTERISVRLSPGQCLFVDNTRILHGRRALPPTSQRVLLRLWVSLDCPRPP